MDIRLTEQKILEDLINTFNRIFNYNILKTEPINRGWLNLKWKITTDAGVFLIKQYNKERYKKYTQEDLNLAFSQQMRLHKRGVPCPKICSYNDTSFFESDNGERFIVMEYCDGLTIPPGRLNLHQMYDLGIVTGMIHRVLNDGSLEAKPRPEFIPLCRGERLAYWRSVWENANNLDKSHLLPIIETHYSVTAMIDLESFNLQETGWAHRDLWVDNLLFKGNNVAAVLDFDRMKYDYPQLDVARAILSGALSENKLDINLASAFLEGYIENGEAPASFLTNSLKLLWYMESTWWINSHMDQECGPPERFAQEMIWLAEHMQDLRAILENM